jgi:hypothetical protein
MDNPLRGGTCKRDSTSRCANTAMAVPLRRCAGVTNFMPLCLCSWLAVKDAPVALSGSTDDIVKHVVRATIGTEMAHIDRSQHAERGLPWERLQ